MDRQKAKAMRRRSTALFMSDPTMAAPLQRLHQISADEDRHSSGLGMSGFVGERRTVKSRRQSALFVTASGGIGSQEVVDEKVMQQVSNEYSQPGLTCSQISSEEFSLLTTRIKT